MQQDKKENTTFYLSLAPQINENVDKDILKRSDIEYLSEHVSRIDEISPQSFATAKITYNGKSETTEIVGTTEVLKDVENRGR